MNTLKILSRIEQGYILSQMSDQSNDRKRKIAIERLCSLFRKGYKLYNPKSVADQLVARLYDPSSKVVRWALNALALLAQCRISINSDAIVDAIKNNLNDCEIVCSGIAALFSICGEEKAIKIIKDKRLPLEGAFVLSASQYSKTMFNRIKKEKINIDTASALDLKHVAILVGLNKAPENIFHPKYPNKDVLGKLNIHPDSKVSQYSIWALVENSDYSINDLSLQIKNIETFKENIRSWIYRLMTETNQIAEKHKEYIFEVASKDVNRKAREGLAISLRGIYFPTLEECVVDWSNAENDNDIKDYLYEHMATVSGKCTVYEEIVKERYRNARKDTSERMRLESAAQGSRLHHELKKISYKEDTVSLFGVPLGGNVNNIFNVGNNAKIGQLVVSSTISNSTIKAIDQVSDPVLKDALHDVKKLLDTYDLPNDLRKEAEVIISEIAYTPTKTSLFTKMSTFLNNAKTALSDTTQAGEDIQALLDIFKSLIS